MKRVVVFTGAGISAESGLATFRDSGGLWEQYRIEDVATHTAWLRNPELVLEFYNQRRKQLKTVKPNAAHYAIFELENKYDVYVITQNVDDLHERAGSKKVLHLHGLLTQARSSVDPSIVYDIGYEDIKIGQKCPKGSQLRPNIVFFEEPVPAMEQAISIVRKADIFIIIGTSLVVYPAASLVHYVPRHSKLYLVDPKGTHIKLNNLTVINETATIGAQKILSILMNHESDVK